MNTRMNGGLPVVAITLLVALGGCATGAKPEAMVVQIQPATRPFPQALQHAMCVRNVTGGEATNPLWASKVDNGAFHTALAASLDGAGLSAAGGNCGYQIDVNLLGLSQPSMGFDMTVTAHVNYKVYDQAGAAFLLETIDAPYTAKMSEAFIGVERLKKANEGAIRQSILMLFDKLRDTTPK